MHFSLYLPQSATASAARPDKDSQTSAGAVAFNEHLTDPDKDSQTGAGAVAFNEHLTDPDKDSQVGAVAGEHEISFRWIPTC